MSSFFRQIAQSAMNPALDSTFGETVLYVPMRNVPNGSPMPDPARPSVEAVAVFSWKADMAFAGRDKADHKGQPRRDLDGPISVQTRKPVFSFAAPCAPSPMRRGDHIVRSCADGTRWEITHKAGDGTARIEVHVVQVGLSNDEAL